MSMRNTLAVTSLAIALSLPASHAWAAYVPGFLKGSVFDAAAQKSQIDGLLLYSVALAESASGKGGGLAGPSPLAIRAGNDAFYPKTRQEAEATLRSLLAEGRTNIDVGLMQVNLRWHGQRVASPYELLEPSRNLEVATQILYETLLSSPNDIRTAVGRYHNWEDERGGRYADRVLGIYKTLKKIYN